ncbi:MAG: mannose-1-phosphate guanylyltransferase/mannose-6-phosphate isomerase [Candidatus Omnitrophota bacterium]
MNRSRRTTNHEPRTNHNYAILLAGGTGSRFWPQSRTLEPKQFLSLHKGKTLFESTLERIKSLIPKENILIATAELYRQQIQELSSAYNIPDENFIYEKEGKNTAPSIGLSCRLIYLRDPLAKVCVLPCDHLIQNKSIFVSLLKEAFSICAGRLVVFGILPDRPATGYGYIKVRSPQTIVHCGPSTMDHRLAYEVERFTEKPDSNTAKRFVREKKYFWNSGIFAGSVKSFLNSFSTNQPVIYKQLLKLKKLSDMDRVWKNMPSISFDYAILEKSGNLLMILAKGLGWSDLGSWQAWDEILTKDKTGNVFRADVINLDSKNITVLGNKRLIATIGLDDLIIVDTPDALLITKKGESEKVKNIVEILKKDKRQEHYAHRTVKRPWGSYTVMDIGAGFKVKLVEVKPKRSLSLQFHKERAEHWVVVDGVAQITKGKKKYKVYPNESTFIPLSCIHRITNIGNKALKIVEVQTGDYLEEDDIIRLKDEFGRT